MSTKQRVAVKVAAIQEKSPVKLSGSQLADILEAEFPELARITLERYCCPGRVAEVRQRFDRDYELIVVTSDWHIPFHNVPLVESWLDYVYEAQPDHIVLNGDIIDCLAISSFDKPPGVPLMQDEIDAAITLLDRLQANCPTSKIYYLDGNHEQRLERLLMREPGLYGLNALKITQLLGLHRRGIQYLPYMKPLTLGQLTCVHGDRVSKHAAYAAKAQLTDYGYRNLCIGHTHRLGMYSHTGAMGKRRAIEGGGFFDVDQADYMRGQANWQNGFIVARQTEDWLQMTPVECSKDGRFCVDGVMYGAG